MTETNSTFEKIATILGKYIMIVILLFLGSIIIFPVIVNFLEIIITFWKKYPEAFNPILIICLILPLIYWYFTTDLGIGDDEGY